MFTTGVWRRNDSRINYGVSLVCENVINACSDTRAGEVSRMVDYLLEAIELGEVAKQFSLKRLERFLIPKKGRPAIKISSKNNGKRVF